MIGNKSSQKLIQQLRIKSVRQSKVRIIKDESKIGQQFDVVVDPADLQERKDWIPSRYTTSKNNNQGLNKVVSNATNLHRASDTTFLNTPALSSNPSRIANLTFAKEV